MQQTMRLPQPDDVASTAGHRRPDLGNAKAVVSRSRPVAWFGGAMTAALSGVLVAAIATLLWLAFRDGVADGRYRQLSPFGAGHFVNAVCAVISVEKYGTGRYVCATAARRSMTDAGLDFDGATLARFHMTLSEWARDTAFLNTALQASFAKPRAPWDGSVLPIGWGTDAGYQDFVQFAFFLFGRKIQALHSALFLLLTTSSISFALQFYNRPFALFTLAGALYAVYVFFHRFLPIFQPGLNNPRWLSVLALIPLLHAMFLILYRVRLSPLTTSLYVPQAAMMAAADNFLSSCSWTLIALWALSVIVIGYGWSRRRKTIGQSFLRCWPTGVATGCIGLGMFAAAVATDPRLAQIGGMRMHSLWEPLFYDLQISPEWHLKYAAQYQNATGDATTAVAVASYLKRHPIPAHSSDYLHRDKDAGLTQAAYEKYTRLSYLEFLRNDPIYVLSLKYFDLQVLTRALEFTVLSALQKVDWSFVVLFGWTATVYVYRTIKTSRTFSVVTAATASLLLFAIIAASPTWIIVPELEVMGGPFVVALLFSIIAAFWMVVAAVVGGRRLLLMLYPALQDTRV